MRGGRDEDVTSDARRVIQNEGLTVRELLRENEYETDGIWNDNVIARSKWQLMIIWLSKCVLVSLVGGISLLFFETPVIASRSKLKEEYPMTLMPGVQVEEYWNALNAAYDRDSLARMLKLRLNRGLDHLVADGPFADMTFELLSVAEREGWHVELIQAAHHFNPGNAALMEVYDKYGLAPAVRIQQSGASLEAAPESVSAAGFEKTIQKHLPIFDIVAFREGLVLVEGWACRIESNGNALGSGFLVGPDLVMTNYHVMEGVIENPTRSSNIMCRFDYKRLSDGSKQTGVEIPMHATEWNVCHSKYSSAEKRGKPDAELPTIDELDYCLIRLADAVGEKSIGPADSLSPARGWVRFPADLPAITPPIPMIIAQHPDGAPLKLAMDTDGIKSVNANGTRVRYDTTTESGSSGSPCFDFKWSPLALHHYGDPGSEFHSPQYNQGIPFALIRDHLIRNGHPGII